MHVTGLFEQIERDLNTSDLRVILINSLASFNKRTGLAQILGSECLAAAGSYQPVPISYTPGTAVDNQTLDRVEAPPFTAQFTEAISGQGYEHTHVALIKRAGIANRPATLDVATDVITCTNHGLPSGARAVIRSDGTLPGGAAITGGGYYVNPLSVNTLELYTDAGLTSKVNFTSAGAGQLYLQNCSGALYQFLSNPGTINAGQVKTFQVIYAVD